jgi:hypothetical protein
VVFSICMGCLLLLLLLLLLWHRVGIVQSS